jgi:hypothetical protein
MIFELLITFESLSLLIKERGKKGIFLSNTPQIHLCFLKQNSGLNLKIFVIMSCSSMKQSVILGKIQCKGNLPGSSLLLHLSILYYGCCLQTQGFV